MKNTYFIPKFPATCPPKTAPPNAPKYPADMLKPNTLPVRDAGVIFFSTIFTDGLSPADAIP